jgi:hypothetical protein
MKPIPFSGPIIMSIMTPAAPAKKPVGVRQEVAFRELEDRLRETQQAVVRQRLTAGLFWIGTAVALFVVLMALADYFAELATVWRAIALIGALGAVASAGVLGWRRWIAPYTLSRAAADAEGHVAQFGQRLRTTLDYDRQDPRPALASPMLLTALQNDTFQMAKKANWDDVVDARPVFTGFAAGAFVAFVWGVAFVASGDFRIATARALLLPFEYTTVTYSPQTTVVKIGEAVEIKAEVAGRPIESARLRYRPAGSQEDWTTLDLAPRDDYDGLDPAGKPRGLLGELFVTMSDLKHDLDFEVLAGPRLLPPGSIQVLQPLTLKKSAAHIIPPAYTGRPEETVAGLDLKVLEGSTVDLRLELNRAPAEARIDRVDGDPPANRADGAAMVPPTAELAIFVENNVIHSTLPDLRRNTTFTITAKAADGMLLDPQRLTIRVQLDRKPEVKFIQPPEELVVTATTEVPMIVEASDDIGLHKVGIMYQVGTDEMQTLWEQDGEGTDEPLTGSTLLMLEELSVTYKDAITYYAFAEDNYFGQPRRTTTPLRYIDIRPYKQAFQVAEGSGGCCNGSVTLEELIARQRQNLSLSFAAQDQLPVEKETIAGLGAAQAELLEKTREFTEGMEQRGGPIPALTAAVKEMEQAVDAFEASQLALAIPAEQEALADLISARENLRKKLSQSNSPSASECRKFDREQRQKLRLPEKKQQDRQQQVADLRKKIEDLAKRERQWSQSCAQCNSSSSSQSKSSAQKSSSQSQSQSKSETERQQASSSQKQGGAQQPLPDQQDAASKDHGQPEGKPSSPEEIAAAQEKLREELAELRERLAKLNAAGKAAGEQARGADESMRQGLENLKKQDAEGAATEGERSARQLEQLADHLAAMNARDFGQRLEQARQLARQLADREESLEKQLGGGKSKKGEKTAEAAGDENGSNSNQAADASGAGEKGGQEGSKAVPAGTPGSGEILARDQRALAGQADLLAEQLEALERDAATERGGMKGKLAQLQKENPPRDIAGVMRQSADDLAAQRRGEARRGAIQARERLDELSRALGDLRADYAQPRLEELVALEEQLAQLLEQLKRAGESQSAVSAAKRKWDDLEQRLDGLAAGDRRLADALRELREGRSSKERAGNDASNSTAAKADQAVAGGTRPPQPGDKLKPAPFVLNDGREMPEGHYAWLELGDINGIRQVSKVLQARIQEAILAGALMDSDQPVPPEYRDLVEKYYRALSDDLR